METFLCIPWISVWNSSRKGAKGAEIYLHTECTEWHRIFRQKDIRTYFCRRNFAILCDFAWDNYTPHGISVNSCPFVAQKIRVDTRKYVETFLCIPCIAFPSQVRTATLSSVWKLLHADVAELRRRFAKLCAFAWEMFRVDTCKYVEPIILCPSVYSVCDNTFFGGRQFNTSV